MEYENLDAEIKRFTPVLVFNLIPLAEIASEMGFKTKRPTDELFDYYRTKCVFGEGRKERLRAFNDRHEILLTPIVAEKLTTIQHKDIVEIAERLFSNPAIAPLGKDEILKLQSHIQNALPLLRRLTSDSASPEDREQFRKLFPKGELFEFKDWVTALLSEQALRSVTESRERNTY
jgi:hypothetical protein